MAGAGYKQWVDGDILTAGDVNTYLMDQAVMVFATASARTSAITTPSEGMVTYRADANVIEYYDGAAWQPLLDQDVIAAKGDLIVGTGDDTVSRLAVGTNNHVLTADSSTATGLKWAAASAGSLTLISTASPSSVSTVTMDSVFSASYRNYMIILNLIGTAQEELIFKFRTSGSDNSNTNYSYQNITADGTTISGARSVSLAYGRISTNQNGYYTSAAGYIFAPNVAIATTWNSIVETQTSATLVALQQIGGIFSASTAFDGIKIYSANNNNFSGKISIYGVSE